MQLTKMHLTTVFVLAMALMAKHVHCDTMVPYCVNSGQQIQNTTNGLTITGVLPKQLGQSVVCQFTTERTSSQFLSIKLKTEGSVNTTNYRSLRVMVYDSKLQYNIGSLEIKDETTSHETNICLNDTVYSHEKYVAIISGTPLLSYAVSIEFASHHLSLNKNKKFVGPRLFFFSTLKANPDAQLDVTVKSKEESKAVLRVSTFCDQVEKLGVINKDKPAITLTFSKQGRITLSKVSQPRLSASQPLFIGVLGSQDNLNNKSFTIEITNSFDYDYTAPLCFIVFVPLAGGILVALWALYCFREPLDLGRGTSESTSLDSSAGSSTISRASSVACWSGRKPNELSPLIRQPHISLSCTTKEILWAMLKVVKYHWSGHGSRAFSYITCVVGFVLFVGAFQYVYESWNIMVEEGDRDRCFYDDLCYRVSPYSDIPFNLMISNMAYLMHGMVLAIAVWVMEAELYVHARKKACLDRGRRDDPRETSADHEALPKHALVCSSIGHHLPELKVPPFNSEHRLLELYANAYMRKYSFSVGYAFSWALIFEGLFSLTYHLCPSRLSFQFDTAFMFVIAGLIVVSLFNGLAVRECGEQDLPKPIEDTTFYLFIIVPLYILNYLGSVFITKDRKHRAVNAVFLVLIVCWYLGMFSLSGFKLFYFDIRHGFHNCASKVKLLLFCLTWIITCIVFPILFSTDFSNLFLFSCIAVAGMSTIGKIILNSFKAPPVCYSTCKAALFKAVQMAYVLAAFVLMIIAVYIFDGIPTSDKTESPEKSRNLNKECAFLKFYDYHDIWHIMSSFALLMGSFLVMYISE